MDAAIAWAAFWLLAFLVSLPSMRWFYARVDIARDDLILSRPFIALEHAYDMAREAGRPNRTNAQDPDRLLADFIAGELFEVMERAKPFIEKLAEREGARRAAAQAELESVPA